MRISIWDTYVYREDGKEMHFDIIVPNDLKDETKIVNFGKAYLKSKPFATKDLSTKACRFCHVKNASEEIEKEINKNGYFIIEIEHCN